MEDNNQPNENVENKPQDQKEETPIKEEKKVEEQNTEKQEAKTENKSEESKVEANKEAKETVKEEAPVQNANKAETKFNVSSEQPKPTKKKSKGKKVALIITLLLIIAIAAALVYYFMFYSKPEEIYKRAIQGSIDTYINSEPKNNNFKTIKSSVKLDLDVDVENDDIDDIGEKILDLLNKTDIAIEVQADKENKETVINVESNYNKKSLLNLQMFSNIEDEKTYIYLKDFLNKYIEAEVNDEFYESMSKILEEQPQVADVKIPMAAFKNEFLKIIKPEYCSSSKEDITVNGTTVNATKNTIKLNTRQLQTEMVALANNLKANQDFMNFFENKEIAIEALDKMIEELEDLDTDENVAMEFNLYTQGLMHNAVKFSVTANVQYQAITIGFTKNSDNNYEIEILLNNMKLATGKVNVEEKNENEGKVGIEFNIDNAGKFGMNLEYSRKFDEKLDKVDTKNTVKADKLTQVDQMTLMANLQKSELYKLIESFSGTSLNKTLNSNTTTNTNTSTSTTTSTSKDTKTKDNEVITYDSKNKITYQIPVGYTVRTTSDNYKTLEKGDSSIRISSKYADKDKYYDTLKTSKEYYEKQENYKNVELSEMATKTISGRTYYSATLSYEYVSGTYSYKNSTTYIWTEVSDKYVLDLEIRKAEGIAEAELDEILTIKVEENK